MCVVHHRRSIFARSSTVLCTAHTHTQRPVTRADGATEPPQDEADHRRQIGASHRRRGSRCGHFEEMPKCSSSSPSGQQLIDSCKSGNNLAAVQKLLDDGVDVNWKDNIGSTALCWASVEGRVEIIKLLLDRGAQIDIQNIVGWTALMIAVWNGKVECVRLLQERGADMSLKCKSGKTARDQAVERGHVEIVLLLDEVSMLQTQDP
jgi:hypothetical protein